jgi:peptide/nickel transport system substrate-binding protein
MTGRSAGEAARRAVAPGRVWSPVPAKARAMASVLMATVPLACGSGDSNGGVESGAATADAPVEGRRILRVAYNREIDVLNAFTSQNLVDIEFSMVEGLITTDENNTYVPVLAREIPTEENGLVVLRDDGTVEMTWRLHEDVRWHDGEPLTSADVCFTWRFVASEGSVTYNRDQYLGILDCQTPDDHAGIFEAVLPEHVLGGMTTDEIVNYEPYNRGPETIGTGPFKFAEWKTGEYIRVVRNDDYWRGSEYPAIDEVVWAFIPDSNTRLNALLAGQYHYGQIEPTQVAEVQDLPGYQINLISSNSVMHFDLSVNTPRGRMLFDDPSVRRAMFHAIDRGAIAEQLMQGTVIVADTPINPSSPYHNPDVVRYDFDPERSRRMLDETGWTEGPDGIRIRDGERFSFQMINRAGSSDRIAIAQVIQAQLKDVGIAVTFETLESAAWTQRWRSGRWEGIVSAWFLPADPSITGLYACGGPNNMTGLCDPELDEVMEASDRTIAFEDRKPILDQAQAMWAEAAMSLPIYYNVVPEVVSTDIRGYRGSGTNFGSFWNLWEWSLVR